MTDDLAYWGATEADDATLPPPETRRIGERLFVRPRGLKPGGKPARIPLRLTPDQMAAAIAEGDGVAQLGYLVGELGDATTKAAWAGLDFIDREMVAAAYFAAVKELLGMAAGESSR